MNTRSILGILFVIVLGLPLSAAAGTISGKVLNSTSAQPAAGDDVILLRLGEGMEEESRTKTGPEGAFTFSPASANALYVVRVMHQGVNYDQSISGTAPLVIEVFDAVARIPGLSGDIGMAQMESDGKIVKVTEMYGINNSSVPPVTQSSPRNFEVFLPEKAVFDSVEARRGEGIWIKILPTPVKGQVGHYAINYPLRPGETLIKFTYHLPNVGPTTFRLKLPYPIKKFAVMHPPSLSFKASRPNTFTNPGQASGLQVEAAVKRPLVGDVPPFEISGVGVAPPPAPEQAAVPIAVTQAAATPAAAPPPAPGWPSWLVVLAAAGVLMSGALAFGRWRKSSSPATAGVSTPARTNPARPDNRGAPPLLEALKEELFQLEVDRAKGSISADEYAAVRQALNQTLARAMRKGRL